MKKKVGEIFTAMYDLIKKPVNSILGGVEKMANGVVEAINTVIRALNNLKIDIPKELEKITGIKSFGFNIPTIGKVSIPRLDTGTNYVPEDQLALIHKGESVIPKKFNSKEYFGNDEETKVLLRELIRAVDNIDVNPYTTIKDVGQNAVNYINSQRRKLGRSVI